MTEPSKVSREELVLGEFFTHDGLKLASYRVHARGERRGAVVLIHGLSDHSRSLPYLALAAALRGAGFEVFAYDRRGSGISEGPPNYASSWDDLMQDLSRFVDVVEDQCSVLPALVGLSLGGLEALDFALRSPESVPACVALAPALDLSGTSPFLRKILPFLASWFPRAEVETGLDESATTRSKELIREYLDDPLWRRKSTLALGSAVMGAIRRVQSRAGALRVPLLILHGAEDRVVPIGGTKSFVAALGEIDKTFRAIPEAFHALPIEPGGDRICGEIANWLCARMKATAPAGRYPS